jgi:DNA-binding MarR family transcriptional regulator
VAERDLVAGVVQLSNLLNRRLAGVFEKASVTPQQWGILSALADRPTATTLASIARTLQVSKQNMTGMIARLEQLGLVERDDDPNDLRSARLQLTRRGRATIEKLRPAYDAWLAQMGSDIGDRDLQSLKRTIDRLIARLEEG